MRGGGSVLHTNEARSQDCLYRVDLSESDSGGGSMDCHSDIQCGLAGVKQGAHLHGIVPLSACQHTLTTIEQQQLHESLTQMTFDMREVNAMREVEYESLSVEQRDMYNEYAVHTLKAAWGESSFNWWVVDQIRGFIDEDREWMWMDGRNAKRGLGTVGCGSSSSAIEYKGKGKGVPQSNICHN